MLRLIVFMAAAPALRDISLPRGGHAISSARALLVLGIAMHVLVSVSDVALDGLSMLSVIRLVSWLRLLVLRCTHSAGQAERGGAARRGRLRLLQVCEAPCLLPRLAARNAAPLTMLRSPLRPTDLAVTRVAFERLLRPLSLLCRRSSFLP